MSFPTCDADFGAFAWLRRDREFVAETLGAAKAEPHPLAGRESILQGLLDIGDARALVFEGEANAAPAALFDEFQHNLSAPAIVQRVARKLAGGRDDLGLIHKA